MIFDASTEKREITLEIKRAEPKIVGKVVIGTKEPIMLNGTHVVLLVDDDQEPLDLLEHYFERNEYITRSAHSVVEAIQKLDETLDLVVTDYDMPVMNGSDLLLMIRQKFPTIPVIGISGLRFMPGNRIDQLFDAFLPKPFRINALRESVANVILWASAADAPLRQGLLTAK